MFGAATIAKCCELKRRADRVRSRTQERESPERQISVHNFFTFVVFAKRRFTMGFRAKNAGYSTRLSQVCATSYWLPCGADRQAYGKRDGLVAITSLPKFLGLIDNHFSYPWCSAGADSQRSAPLLECDNEHDKHNVPTRFFFFFSYIGGNTSVAYPIVLITTPTILLTCTCKHYLL